MGMLTVAVFVIQLTVLCLAGKHFHLGPFGGKIGQRPGLFTNGRFGCKMGQFGCKMGQQHGFFFHHFFSYKHKMPNRPFFGGPTRHLFPPRPPMFGMTFKGKWGAGSFPPHPPFLPYPPLLPRPPPIPLPHPTLRRVPRLFPYLTKLIPIPVERNKKDSVSVHVGVGVGGHSSSGVNGKGVGVGVGVGVGGGSRGNTGVGVGVGIGVSRSMNGRGNGVGVGVGVGAGNRRNSGVGVGVGIGVGRSMNGRGNGVGVGVVGAGNRRNSGVGVGIGIGVGRSMNGRGNGVGAGLGISKPVGMLGPGIHNGAPFIGFRAGYGNGQGTWGSNAGLGAGLGVGRGGPRFGLGNRIIWGQNKGPGIGVGLGGINGRRIGLGIGRANTGHIGFATNWFGVGSGIGVGRPTGIGVGAGIGAGIGGQIVRGPGVYPRIPGHMSSAPGFGARNSNIGTPWIGRIPGLGYGPGLGMGGGIMRASGARNGFGIGTWGKPDYTEPSFGFGVPEIDNGFPSGWAPGNNGDLGIGSPQMGHPMMRFGIDGGMRRVVGVDPGRHGLGIAGDGRPDIREPEYGVTGFRGHEPENGYGAGLEFVSGGHPSIGGFGNIGSLGIGTPGIGMPGIGPGPGISGSVGIGIGDNGIGGFTGPGLGVARFGAGSGFGGPGFEMGGSGGIGGSGVTGVSSGLGVGIREPTYNLAIRGSQLGSQHGVINGLGSDGIVQNNDQGYFVSGAGAHGIGSVIGSPGMGPVGGNIISIGGPSIDLVGPFSGMSTTGMGMSQNAGEYPNVGMGNGIGNGISSTGFGGNVIGIPGFETLSARQISAQSGAMGSGTLGSAFGSSMGGGIGGGVGGSSSGGFGFLSGAGGASSLGENSLRRNNYYRTPTPTTNNIIIGQGAEVSENTLLGKTVRRQCSDFTTNGHSAC